MYNHKHTLHCREEHDSSFFVVYNLTKQKKYGIMTTMGGRYKMGVETIQTELIKKEVSDLIAKENTSNVFQDKLRELVNIPMSETMRESFTKEGVPIENGRLLDAMSASLILQAVHGNIAAYMAVRDTLGYKPVDKVENDVTISVRMPEAVRELGE